MKRYCTTLKSLIVLSFFISLLAITFGCKEEEKVIKPNEITFVKHGELIVYKAKTDSVIGSFDIEIADDDYETQTGLMHRPSMANTNAMLFIFPDTKMRSFYMKNTLIPLDIIYLDDNKTVVSIQEHAKPMDETSLPSEAPAMYVLEINAGLSKQFSIVTGDRIEFSKSN